MNGRASADRDALTRSDMYAILTGRSVIWMLRNTRFAFDRDNEKARTQGEKRRRQHVGNLESYCQVHGTFCQVIREQRSLARASLPSQALSYKAVEDVFYSDCVLVLDSLKMFT